MKGKRQTIWLVSMLSLMVVLSAYYLFTEDTGASMPKETAGTIQVDSANNGTGGTDSAVLDSGLVINEVDTQGALTTDADSEAAAADDSSTAIVTDPEAVTDPVATTDDDSSTQPAAADDSSDTASASTDTPAKNDDEILEEVAAQSSSASSMFNNYLFEREQQNLKNYNDLIAQISDMEKTPAENAVAQEQLSKLEEKESKINDIETQLQQKYGEAIVKEETGDSYTVVVLSDKLEVKQAVGIVDLVMKELSVTQDKIKVQYVSEQ